MAEQGPITTALLRLPPGWWLRSLEEKHTRRLVTEGIYRPTGTWQVSLQRETGGAIICGCGVSPDLALADALDKVAAIQTSGLYPYNPITKIEENTNER